MGSCGRTFPSAPARTPWSGPHAQCQCCPSDCVSTGVCGRHRRRPSCPPVRPPCSCRSLTIPSLPPLPNTAQTRALLRCAPPPPACWSPVCEPAANAVCVRVCGRAGCSPGAAAARDAPDGGPAAPCARVLRIRRGQPSSNSRRRRGRPLTSVCGSEGAPCARGRGRRACQAHSSGSSGSGEGAGGRTPGGGGAAPTVPRDYEHQIVLRVAG